MAHVPGVLKKGVSLVLLGVGILLIMIGLLTWFGSSIPREYTLTIAAGERAKTRYQLARYLVRKGRHFGLKLETVDTVGSLEVLKEVQHGKVDVALVQGGIRMRSHANIRQVACLNVEPLQLLVRRELADACRRDLGALAGKSVNLSTPESGTFLLATAVLRFAELVPRKRPGEGGYVPLTQSVRAIQTRIDAIRAAEPGDRQSLVSQLPDAVFLVSTLPSVVVRNLVEVANYRLVPLPYSKAFSVVSLNEEVSGRNRIEHMMVLKTEIPAFTYGVSPAVPAKPCETIGAHQVIVANKNVSPYAIERLLEVIYGGTLNHLYKPPPLERVVPQFDWHAGAVAFRDRNHPLVRVELIETLRRVTTILASILTGLFALYGFYRWRQVLRFKAYFAEVAEIEAAARHALHGQSDGASTVDQLRQLTVRIDSTRNRAVEDFADGYFRGESVVVALLYYINSTQQSLHQELTDLMDKR